MTVRSMTQGSPYRLILSVALPLMVGNIFQQLYTVVDAQVVGRVNGVAGLAALGAADWFNWLFLNAVQGMTQGFIIPTAQAFGARDYDGLRRNVGNAAVLTVIVGFVLMAVALCAVHPVLRLMRTPQEILPLSAQYLTIMFAGLPLTAAYNLMAGILRALGNGRAPLYAMIVASLVNIGLDVLFVAGFGWGVGGAAIATVIAQGCACVFCFFCLRRISFLRLSRDDLRPRGALCSRLVALGLPVALQNTIIGVGGMIVQSVSNTLGVIFIAGYTATNKLYGVLEMAAISYSYAMTTYAGQNMGARRADRIRQGVRAAAVMGVITSAVIAGVMLFIGRGVIASFISGSAGEVAESVQIGYEYLRLLSICLPTLYLLYVFRSALQGMGHTIVPLISGISEFFMRIGAASLLPGLIGYHGIFWAEILAWEGANVILICGYIKAIARARRKFESDP